MINKKRIALNLINYYLELLEKLINRRTTIYREFERDYFYTQGLINIFEYFNEDEKLQNELKDKLENLFKKANKKYLNIDIDI